jgi:hypothetical protein
VLQEETQNSLQARINGYLRGKPKEYAVEESGEEVAKAIFDCLKKAEEDLEAAQDRVKRLRWELLKAKE